MCIFCVPDKLDKTSIDFVKTMHQKYYVPLITLVEEMDALRKTYKNKTDYHNEAELPKLLEANYLPKFKELVLSFALENISLESNVTVAALKAMVENAYRRTQKYVDWKDYKFALCEQRAALHKTTWPTSRDYFDSKIVYEALYAKLTEDIDIATITPEAIQKVEVGQGYSDLLELFHAPGSLLQESDFDYQYQWKSAEANITVVINNYGIVEKIV
jgi:hypothetical protein